jgi:hypothetical protein
MVLMSHNREASKVTVNSSYFHPAHQHYTDEAHKAETTASKVGLDFMLQEFLASDSQNNAQKRNIVAGIRLNTTKGPNCMQESGSQIKKQESRSRSSPPPNNVLNVRPCVALLYYFKNDKTG